MDVALRQEHLAGAEQVADHVHAIHQRAFDHRQRRLALREKCGAAFLGVGHDVFRDALDHRVFEAPVDTPFTPGQIDHLLAGLPLDPCREFDQHVAGPRSGIPSGQSRASANFAVEHDILDSLAQLGCEVVIDAELAGIDDAHGEAGLDRVIEEHGMDRLAHRIVAAEGK